MGWVGFHSRLQTKLTCNGVRVEVNRVHYWKLRALFERHNPRDPTERRAPKGKGQGKGKGKSEFRKRFDEAAFCLLARYSSLQGTHYRGGGFQVSLQNLLSPDGAVCLPLSILLLLPAGTRGRPTSSAASVRSEETRESSAVPLTRDAGRAAAAAAAQAAIHSECFDVLREEMGVRVECFASPLNSRYGLGLGCTLSELPPRLSVGKKLTQPTRVRVYADGLASAQPSWTRTRLSAAWAASSRCTPTRARSRPTRRLTTTSSRRWRRIWTRCSPQPNAGASTHTHPPHTRTHAHTHTRTQSRRRCGVPSGSTYRGLPG